MESQTVIVTHVLTISRIYFIIENRSSIEMDVENQSPHCHRRAGFVSLMRMDFLQLCRNLQN